MGQIAISLPPPKLWQDFEKLMWELHKIEWNDPYAKMNGRQGQGQHGVDVFGVDQSTGRMIGLQCKRREKKTAQGHWLAGQVLTAKDILEEVGKAEEFSPSLEHFILATTQPQDAETQSIISGIDKARRSKNKFTVSGLFWDEIEILAERHTSLLYLFYEQFLKAKGEYHKDRHLLTLLQSAFSRPAFNTLIVHERSGQHMLDAVVDCQEAIRTGTLYDRETKQTLEKAPISDRGMENAAWKARCEAAWATLQQLSKVYAVAKRAKTLFVYADGSVRPENPEVEHALNGLRANTLRLLNENLKEAGLDPVDSTLLQVPHFPFP